MTKILGFSTLWCLLLGVVATPAWAVDPPHDFTTLPDDPCASCHTPHTSSGGALTTVAGNANLCISCHNPGGPASALPFADADKALPAPGLPPSVTPSGNSHRWDSGPSGWVETVAGNTSPGTVQSGGAFTGRYAKTYTITITASGDSGVASFSWSATAPGGGSGSDTTGVDVALDEGTTATFTDGVSSPSFVAGDEWRVYVRTDLNDPTAAKMLARLEDGKIMCSTCHDQHSQKRTPFTPQNTTPPEYTGPGTGAGRHFMRVDNDSAQMCVDCHSPRDVLDSSLGSHPVGADTVFACTTCHGPAVTNIPDLSITPTGPGMQVVCLSCHQPHYAPTSDGSLARRVNTNTMCANCHILADTATPASHVDPLTGVLWPGGEYGSTFPEITDAGKTGFCTNCHWPHGWPDDAAPANDYQLLLVERSDLADDRSDPNDAEDLCYTCHDASGPAKDVKAEFAKANRHPIVDGLQTADRSVECRDCHNVHRAQSGVHNYLAAATSSRNQVSPVLTDVSGSRPTSWPGNYVAPATYTSVPSATYEYEICFKCHTRDATGTGDGRNRAQEFNPNNASSHPVVQGLSAAPGTSPLDDWQMVAPWDSAVGTQTMMCSDCHNTNADSPAAQGPHGSAVSFMLRGPKTLWPPTTLIDGSPNLEEVYNTSFCSNCHFYQENEPNNFQNEAHDKHDNRDLYCYSCHIIVPHGGKLGRLIGDRETMPARYAYQGNLSNMWVSSFRKRANQWDYDKEDCGSSVGACADHDTPVSTQNW